MTHFLTVAELREQLLRLPSEYDDCEVSLNDGEYGATGVTHRDDGHEWTYTSSETGRPVTMPRYHVDITAY